MTVLYFGCFAVVSGALLSTSAGQPEPANANAALIGPEGFIVHIANLLRTEPMLFVLQVVRALLWAALAVPMIKMMKGEWWESGLAVALLFAVMTSQLLLPNPLMPAEVRMVHLVETATSNFLLAGWSC